MAKDIKTLEEEIEAAHDSLRGCADKLNSARKKIETRIDEECEACCVNFGLQERNFVLTPLAKGISAEVVEIIVQFSKDVPDDIQSRVSRIFDEYHDDIVPVLLQAGNIIREEKEAYLALVEMTRTEPVIELESASATLYLSVPGKSSLYCCDADLIRGRISGEGITSFSNDSPLSCREALVREGNERHVSVYIVSAASGIVKGGDAFAYATGKLHDDFGLRLLRNIDSSLGDMVFEFGESVPNTEEELLARIAEKTSALFERLPERDCGEEGYKLGKKGSN